MLVTFGEVRSVTVSVFSNLLLGSGLVKPHLAMNLSLHRGNVQVSADESNNAQRRINLSLADLKKITILEYFLIQDIGRNRIK